MARVWRSVAACLAVPMCCGVVIASAAGVRTYVAECGSGALQVKPGAWSAGCTSKAPALTELAWTGWGTARAVGTGKLRGTASGGVTPLFDGRLTLTNVRRLPCQGRPRQYTRAVVRWTLPTEPGAKAAKPVSRTYDIGRPCPRYVLGEKGGRFLGLGVERPRGFKVRDADRYGNLRWRNWGLSRATAQGDFYTSVLAPLAVTLTAYGLNTDAKCGVRPAYSRLRVVLAGSSIADYVLCD